ncbi:hypothetical protein ACU62C_19150 [Klebsiella aerogenes]
MDARYEPATETQQVRRLLQAAVDHYPRLLAVEFSLQFPLPVIRTDLENIIPVLLSAIASLTGEYADQRQAAGKSAPPTLLRAIWGYQGRGIQMLLMLNRDTFYHPRWDKFSTEEDIRSLLFRACDEVSPQLDNATLIFPTEPCVQICRQPGEQFTLQFAELNDRAKNISRSLTISELKN